MSTSTSSDALDISRVFRRLTVSLSELPSYCHHGSVRHGIARGIAEVAQENSRIFNGLAKSLIIESK